MGRRPSNKRTFAHRGSVTRVRERRGLSRFIEMYEKLPPEYTRTGTRVVKCTCNYLVNTGGGWGRDEKERRRRGVGGCGRTENVFVSFGFGYILKWQSRWLLVGRRRLHKTGSALLYNYKVIYCITLLFFFMFPLFNLYNYNA